MSKPEWGQKHNCYNCVKPFYDMNKTPAKCPSCDSLAEERHHTSHLSTLHLHANEDDIVLEQPQKNIHDILEEKLALDFSNDLTIDPEIGEYFEDDLEDVIELSDTLQTDRIQ